MMEKARRVRELILNSAGEGIHGLDPDGAVIFGNPKAAELLGWQTDELLGKPAHDITHHKHPDGSSYPIDHCPIHASMRDGKTRRVTNDVFWRKDGTSFRVDYVASPIKDNAGKIVGTIVTFKDITEQFAAESRLKLQEQQYRLLFETNPKPMWVFDTRTAHVLAVNQAAIAHYGYSHEEFLKLNLKDLRVPEDIPDLIKTESQESPVSMSHFGGQVRHVKKDATIIVVEIYSGPIVWGGVAARVVTAIDVTERKRVEEELQTAHQHLQHLLAHLPAVLYVLKIKAQSVVPIVVSDNVERLLGVTVAEATHQWWLNSLHPEDRERVLGEFTEALSGTGCSMEYRIRHKDGTYHWVVDNGRVVRDSEGKAQEIVGVWTDITERKRTEQALRVSKQLIEGIIDAIPVRVFWKDKDLVYLGCNTAFARDAGFSDSKEIIGKDDYQMGWREQAELYRSDDCQVIESGQAKLLIEEPLTTPDGETITLLTSKIPLRNPDGKIGGVIGTYMDITARKQADKQLREQADIIDRAQDAIIIRNYDDQRIIFWNKGAERLYGWTAEELLDRSDITTLAEPKQVENIMSILHTAGEFRGEVRQLTKDKRELMADARVTLVRDADNTPRSILIICTDVTEQKNLEKQLVRSQRLESIGTLASGVAHDLNNVLVPILMAAPILRSEETQDERDNLLNIIEASAQRGAHIVKQVLTFARGAEGDRVLLQPIYLLEEIARIAQETFPKSIRMRTKYPEDLGLVVGDPTQLHQVLLNLCVNARDAMPNGGTISLTAENFDIDEQYTAMTPGLKPGSHVLLSVIDNGCGIPVHIIDKIFDPFFTTKELGKGTGLGLSTVLGIVKSHNGVVNVYSANSGTTFRVFLPAAAGESPVEAKVEASLPAGHGETILVVDDEAAIRAVSKAVLCKNGYKVLLAEDGPSALALFAQQQNEVDVVLTDYGLPIMDGLALARTMRKMGAKAKIIVSTARDSDCNPDQLSEIGVEETLVKPYTQQILLGAIDRVLNNAP